MVAGGNSATYSYIANSPLAGQIFFTNGTTWRMTTSRTYDLLNRLQSIGSVSSASSVVSFSYSYNSANQRTLRREDDQSVWRFDYDSLGQVKSGKRYWSDFTPVAGQQFEYAFDDIGNRTSARAGGDENGANLRAALYYPNVLNQYWSNTVPGVVDVVGVAFATSTVTVNDLPVYRKGEYFRKELPVNNSAGPVWASVTVAATGQTSVSGNVAVPPVKQDFDYDADGNLTQDGLWIYHWNGENRLLAMESVSSLPDEARKGVEFKYDHQGRRIEKIVYIWDPQESNYIPQSTQRFVYDGWNLIAVLDENNSPLLSFSWGTDLSGSLQGAGGVGGLLSVTVHFGPNTGTYFYCYDGNGNVAALVSAADGTIAARYEYGPFGELLRANGPACGTNPFRFSTKYQDDETDLLYYGYRFYNASTGRWLSRDPVEERGGLNLYSFAGNDPLTSFDALGQTGLTYHQGTVIPGNCGQFSSWITWSLDNNRSSSDATSGGIIVQQVSVSFNVRLCDKASSPFHFGPPSDMRIDPGAWPLYEAWDIPPGASHPTRSGSPAVDDIFAMPNFGVGTRGSITISATADYFDGQVLRT